jgi:hypothetical protein
MSTRIFEVPSEDVLDFAERLDELELSNQIVGRNDSDEIIIEVFYSHQQKSEVLDLVDWFTDNIDSENDDDE